MSHFGDLLSGKTPKTEVEKPVVEEPKRARNDKDITLQMILAPQRMKHGLVVKHLKRNKVLNGTD